MSTDALKEMKHVKEILEELGLSKDRKIEIDLKLAEIEENQKAWEKWYIDYVRRPLRYQEFLFGCFWCNLESCNLDKLPPTVKA